MATTPTYNFELIDFDKTPWSSKNHDNWKMIDAILANFIPSSSIQGVWQNSLAVTVGQRYVDPDLGTIWEVLVAHTTAASGTFATERASNTSFWQSFTVTFSNKGIWTDATDYTVNDFVVDGIDTGAAIGIVIANHTSTTSYDTGVADGNTITLIDLSDEVTATAADVAATAADVITTTADKAAAAASAAAASTSETNAGNSATAAAASETAAETAETNAETAETNAETAETNAETAETNAAASASTASTQASNASTSATEAANSATAAANSAAAAAASAAEADAEEVATSLSIALG